MIPARTKDGDIHYLGANQTVVVELAEIDRVAVALQAIGGQIDSIRKQLTAIWIHDPGLLMLMGSMRRELDAAELLADSLAADCQIAAAGYLTAENLVLGAFLGLSDSHLLPLQARLMINAGFAGAAVGGLGSPFGNLAIRALTSNLLTNHDGGDLPLVAHRVSAAVAGTQLLDLPEAASAVLLSESTTNCPISVLQLAERQANLGQSSEPEIQIDVVAGTQGRTLFVYLPGTQRWGFGGENPLDMQSNVLALSGSGLAASEAAAVAALRTVGFVSSDRLVLVGHSQGGLVAKNLAASYQSQVRGVITFGAPILASQLSGIPAIVFEHQNDPVPALAGADTEYPAQALTVTRRDPGGGFMQGHQMSSYLVTSRLASSEKSLEFAAVEKQIFADLSQQDAVGCTSYRLQVRREKVP